MDSLNILVVDDSPIITRKLTMMLELLGYKVVKTAATGTEALFGLSRRATLIWSPWTSPCLIWMALRPQSASSKISPMPKL
jgi:CheY-like chemotaxis protein